VATRRRASRRSLTGTISDIQRRVQYLQNRATPTKLANEVVRRTNIQPRAVATDQIALDAVTNDQVAADAIANEQLQNDSISTPKLQNASVEEVKLADDSVSNRTIATDAVSNDNLQDDSVDTPNVQDGKITNSKLAANAVATNNIQNSAVTEAKIQNNAVTNSKIANDAVTESKIANNAVTASQIASSAVGTNELAGSAVTAAKIASSAVTGNKIASGAVTSAKIGSGAVGSDKLASGAVTGAKLANNSVTAAKIASNAVGSSEIASGAVGSSEIANGAVSDAKISGMDGRKLENNSVFSTKMSGPTKDAIVSQGLEVGFGLSKRGNTVSARSDAFASTRHIHFYFIPERDSFGGALQGFDSRTTTGPDGSPSSKKFKKDISDHQIEDPKKLLELPLKKYKYRRKYKNLENSANKEWMHGYLIEDLLELGFDEVVLYNNEGEPDRLNYSLFSALVLELVKTQQQEINYLKDKVDRLESK